LRYRWAGEVMMLWRLGRRSWSRLLPLLRLWRCHRLTLRWRLQLVVRGILMHLVLLRWLRRECGRHRLPAIVLHHGLSNTRMLRVLRMLIWIWRWIACLWRRTLHLRLCCRLRIVERLVRRIGVCRLWRRSLSMLWVSRRSEVRACAAKVLRRVLWVLLRVLHWMLRGS
jgi:hypothetical protein